MGHFERKFQTGGALPTNDCWCQKPRVIALSCGVKISAVHCLVFPQSTRVTDRPTDRQTDGRTGGQNYNSQDRASIAASRGNNETVTIGAADTIIIIVPDGRHRVLYDWGTRIACHMLILLTLSPPISLRLYTLPYWSNPPFLIFDIWALWCSGLSARAPECQKLKMVA